MKLRDVLELDIDVLLPLLRQSGVRALSVGDVSITLTHLPREVKTEIEPSRFEDELQNEKLSCGHSIWEANDEGECLHGCLPENKKEE